MFKSLYPHEYVDSVSSIDYKKLYDKGYRGIIFDIDNTLVPHGKDSTDEIEELFNEIHAIGFKTLLLSNNSAKRVRRFQKNIDTLYIDSAQKPRVVNYLKAIKMMGLQKENLICVGDQIFTDIFGANRSGIDSILVKYTRTKNESKKIGKRRSLEKIVLNSYEKNHAYQNRIGDILIKGFCKDATE